MALTKQEAFLVVYDRLSKTADRANALVTTISEELERTKGEGSILSADGDWKSVFSEIEALDEKLRDTLIERMDLEEIAFLRNTILRIKSELLKRGTRDGRSRVMHFECAYIMNDVFDLDDYLYDLATSVFGHWGGFWFRMATQEVEEDLHVLITRVLDFNASDDDVLQAIRAPESGEFEQDCIEAYEQSRRWIYEQVMAGVKYREIINNLKRKPLIWGQISTPQGIKKAARKYAEYHRLPLPKLRGPGRPPRS